MRQPQRLLIVDDDRTITNSLQIIFSRAGYDARGVYSAEEARALIEDWSPDLAIIDVLLPAMNGVEFAVLLKAEFPACHLMLFSGQPSTGELLEFAEGRGRHFEIVAKPVRPELLLDWAANGGTPAARSSDDFGIGS
jgi:DNA-binding NtrC family response regulator